ncbi:MAG: phosphatase [Desulfobacterales bacterium]|nr:MAG: phosphatase [Desulfobacterales bacterium]
MNDKIFADLHNHTTASDGDFSPAKLVRIAKEKGIKALGITDHDTLNGLRPALAEGKNRGVQILPGVEISVRFNRSFFTGTLHLLAYFAARHLSNVGFCNCLNTLLSGGRGEGLVQARIEKINHCFGPQGSSPLLERDMAYEDIAAYGDNVSRRHFALALSEAFGISDKQTVNKIIGNDSPAYLPSGVSLDAVSDFIKNEPVVAVLAHPAAGSFPGEGHYREVLPPVEIVERLLPELLAAGVKGLEVHYPGHTSSHRALLTEWASRFDLLVTGGSDCHDATVRPLGISGISEAAFLKLKQAVARA